MFLLQLGEPYARTILGAAVSVLAVLLAQRARDKALRCWLAARIPETHFTAQFSAVD